MNEAREIPKRIYGINGGYHEYPSLSSNKAWWSIYSSETSRKNRLAAAAASLTWAWDQFYKQADLLTSDLGMWWNENQSTTAFKNWVSGDLRFDAYIAGGSIAFFYNVGRTENRLKRLSDIDIYLSTKISGELFLEHFENNPEYVDMSETGNPYGPKAALTLKKASSFYDDANLRTNKVQVMVKPEWCDVPWKVVSNFDFWHTYAYWIPKNPTGNRLQMHPYALAAMDNQILLPAKNKIHQYRLRKMAENGWIYHEKNFEGVEIVNN